MHFVSSIMLLSLWCNRFCSMNLRIMNQRSIRSLQSASLNLPRRGTLKAYSTAPRVLSSNEDSSQSLFSFGVIADIQYVDAPDAMNFQNTTMRRYKQSFETFREAISSWDALPESPKCAIVLGDILDGKSATMMNQEKCINDVLEASIKTNYEMLYCFGNHCHYSFSRADLYSKLSPRFLRSEASPSDQKESQDTTLGGNCSPTKLYYDWSPYKGWRFLSLDCYDISLIGASSEGNKKLAEDWLSKNNPNDLSVGAGWFDGLAYNKRRWVPYNGGIGQEQLNWLREVLRKSSEKKEKVVIFCHQPVFAANKPQSLVWNSEEVLDIVREFGNVVIWIAGHDHGGQYSVDPTGIHHLVPPAPLECGVGEKAFGHIEVHKEKLKLKWTGKEPSDSVLPWSATENMNFK